MVIRRFERFRIFITAMPARSLVGSNSLALLASVIDTCRARQASVTDLLARAIHAARLGLPAPALPLIPAHLLGRHGALVGM